MLGTQGCFHKAESVYIIEGKVVKTFCCFFFSISKRQILNYANLQSFIFEKLLLFFSFLSFCLFGGGLGKSGGGNEGGE